MKVFALRFACLWLLLLPAIAHAQNPIGEVKFPKTKIDLQKTEQDSFVMTADTVTYDEKLQITTASGNVEIIQEPNILMADTVSYNGVAGTVTANGHVSLMQPMGNVLFNDYMELSGDLKTGFMKHIGLMLSDNSRMAAASGKRKTGDIMTLNKVVYSPCDLCKENPRKAPIWQLKAAEAVHDKEAQKIEYYDARLEMYGIPVFYTPYFSHSDPSVKSKSGFMDSSLTTDDDLGVFVQNYYYLALAPDYDVTLQGSYSTKQGPLIGADFRRRYRNGKLDLNGTLTQGDFETRKGFENDKIRGHYFADTEFDIDDHWRAGYIGGYTSDPSYLRFYNISSEDIIRNRVYAERFDKRNYFALNAYAFQDLRPNRPGDQPNILPQGISSVVGEPGSFLGGRWQADLDLLSVARPDDAQNVQRTSLILSWQRRFLSKIGIVTVADLKGEGNLYSVQNADPNFVPVTRDEDYSETRFYPEGQVTMHYPLAKRYDNSSALIEPIVAYTAIPRVKNTRIPNEDSQNFELDMTNLFALNRYPGLDRVDDSNRVTYGLKGAYDENAGFYSSLFFGQSYNLNRLRRIETNSGLEDDFSDFVGEIQINPNQYWNTNYRVRLDEKDLKPRQHEVRFDIGPPIFRVTGSYAYADQLATDSLLRTRQQQLNFSAVTKLDNYWSLSVYDTRNLGNDDGALVTGAGLQYLDECFALQILGQRDFTQRVGIDSGDTIYFRFSFRNLGDFASPTISPDILSPQKSATSFSSTSSTLTNSN